MTSVIKVDTIQNSSGTDALSISSTGGLLPKGQTAWPAFRLSLTTGQTETATGTDVDVIWNKSSGENCYIQGGMSLSSGVVTVPVDGIYIFSMMLRMDAVGSGYIIGSIVRNNDYTGVSEGYVVAGDPAVDYENLTGSVHFKMSAGDNVRVSAHSGSDTSWAIQSISSFSGSLIAAE